MNRKIVFCDIDNTISNFVETIIPHYNKKYKDKLNFLDICNYDINIFIKPKCKNFWGEFVNNDLWDEIKPYSGVIETLTKLNDVVDLYFVSAGHHITAYNRDQWLAKHFPFYSSSQLIMCRHKYLLQGNLLIDDYLNNFENGKYKGLIFWQRWNEQSSFNNCHLPYITKWNDKALELIYQLIEIK